MRKTFLIKVELEDWTAGELVTSLKSQMPFTTENRETIQVKEIDETWGDLRTAVKSLASMKAETKGIVKHGDQKNED